MKGRHFAFYFRAALLGIIFFCSAVVASQADVSAPIHDWTIHMGNGGYGVRSWTPGHWDMYWGSRIEPASSLAVQYAAVLLPMALVGIMACRFAVFLLRAVSAGSRP